ncbi:ThiF family adenylyltransferase [Enterobacter ludwigii]|uniref:ThiF family adenylyltransferase n=1 Tax=Enterobacter ludwigii TaxID=299767 RepID=UPI0027378FBE|nr:ThiF family adenylyltransferase [Enterobacter ludwigii]MDW5475623.1 ThiF family adenylyltransferase [Enterobacter ludwigii]WLK79440.1 ThiF family adenylyltransferase [Enterobacter ludwigii]
MFQKLVSRNEDLKKLVDRGYALSFDSGYLVVRDIPYLDSNKQLQTAAFISKMIFKDVETVAQDNHQVFFTGSSPCDINGLLIQNLGDCPASLALSGKASDLVVQRQFSNKPIKKSAFDDFYEKIESYTSIISGPAMELFDVTPYTYNFRDDVNQDSVFKIQDTLTSRAEILELSSKFNDEIIAIIGLGGTGSYLLDLMVKTPVKEIRSFDFDDFHIHNAFRSPGRIDLVEFQQKKSKVYQDRYDNFRKGLFFFTNKVGNDSLDELSGVTFAFVCVDNGESRSEIFDVLTRLGIPFIDVGMGLTKKNDGLSGMARVTYYPDNDIQTILDKKLSDLSKPRDNLYRTNIQIGELNALNACLAVIRYKQYKGFYSSEENIYHLLFNISDLKINSESIE